MESLTVADVLLNAYRCSLKDIEMTLVEIEPRVQIKGKRTSIVEIGVPTVILLSRESTPQSYMVDASVNASFHAAVKTLVTTGQRFYVLLRPDWNAPAYLWEKMD